MKRIEKSEDSLKNLWNNVRFTNIHIIKVLDKEREREVKKKKNFFEVIMGENFCNLREETNYIK